PPPPWVVLPAVPAVPLPPGFPPPALVVEGSPPQAAAVIAMVRTAQHRRAVLVRCIGRPPFISRLVSTIHDEIRDGGSNHRMVEGGLYTDHKTLRNGK